MERRVTAVQLKALASACSQGTQSFLPRCTRDASQYWVFGNQRQCASASATIGLATGHFSLIEKVSYIVIDY
jgi:hypothetical protein